MRHFNINFDCKLDFQSTTESVKKSMILAVLFSLLAICPLLTDSSGCTSQYLYNSLPCSIRSQTITIVTDADSAPFLFRVGNSPPFGFDVDLMNYMSDIYGIEFNYTYDTFQNLIPTVQNNRNTISISTQTVTVARMQLVDFAQFFKTGTGFVVRSSYTETITGVRRLCGKRVVFQAGTIQETDVRDQNIKCGSNSITSVSVVSVSDIETKLKSNEADVGVFDEALLVSTVLESNGLLKAVGEPYDIQPYGIVCNKNERKLCCAMVNGINLLIRKGFYERLLKRYSFNYKNNGICPSKINLNETVCSSLCRPTEDQCISRFAHE